MFFGVLPPGQIRRSPVFAKLLYADFRDSPGIGDLPLGVPFVSDSEELPLTRGNRGSWPPRASQTWGTGEARGKPHAAVWPAPPVYEKQNPSYVCSVRQTDRQ